MISASPFLRCYRQPEIGTPPCVVPCTNDRRAFSEGLRIQPLIGVPNDESRSGHPSDLAQLADSDREVKIDGLLRATRHRSRRLMFAVCELLTDRSPEVRMRAAEALARLVPHGSAPLALVSALEDPDVLVRTAAAESLGDIGDLRTRTALRSALNDRSSWIRRNAAESIGSMKNRRDVAILRKRINVERSSSAKLGLYAGLYCLGDRGMLEFMLKGLASRQYRVRCATANMLAHVISRPDDRAVAIEALRDALQRESTVAARSSMQRGLVDLKKRT